MHMLPMALTVGGGLLKAAAQNSAGVQNRNALYGQAREAEATGAADELQLRAVAGKSIGEQRSAQASNGFAGDSGSALDALRESQVNMALDVLRLRREAATRARAMRAEGDQHLAEGRMGAVATLLGTAAQALQMKGDWAAARQSFGPRPSVGVTRSASVAAGERYRTRSAAGWTGAVKQPWGGGI